MGEDRPAVERCLRCGTEMAGSFGWLPLSNRYRVKAIIHECNACEIKTARQVHGAMPEPEPS